MKQFLFFLFFLLQADPVSAGDSKIWRVASLNWPPYSKEGHEDHGQSIERLKQILRRKGIQLKVDFYPWRRAIKVAQSCKYVGYFPAWPEEVKRGFVASRSIDWSELYIIRKRYKKIKYKDLEELFKKYRVGVVKTYIYPKNIDVLIKKYSKNIILAPNEKSLLLMLHRERFDAGISDPKVVRSVSKEIGINNIITTWKIMRKELVLAFNRCKGKTKIFNEILK